MHPDLYDQLLDPAQFFSKLDSLSDDELLGFIRFWHERGEEASEIIAFVNHINSKQKPIDTGLACYDCSGTGGDRANTFNISTAAALVAAAAGVYVTKHGGRSTTSKAGSVDVLEYLDIDLDLDFQKKLEGLSKNRAAFFASTVTGQMLSRVKQLLKANKETGFISLLGPLTNPVQLTGQVIGVGQARWMDTIADLLILLKRKHALVVHSASSVSESVSSGSNLANANNFRLDELSAVSPTEIIEIKVPEGVDVNASNLEEKIASGEVKREQYIITPEDLGIEAGTIEELAGGDAKANAQIIRDILAGEITGTKLYAVCLNAAALLYISEQAESIKAGFEKAQEVIKNGSAKSNYEELLALQ